MNIDSEAILDLVRRVEQFLRDSGMPASRFGREALGDPCFVADLRNGRELRSATAARVRAYLDRSEVVSAEAAAELRIRSRGRPFSLNRRGRYEADR